LTAGVPGGEAETVSSSLVLANLRGVDSHGVIRVPVYIEGIRRGLVKPKATVTVVRDHGSFGLIDGGNGLGIVAASTATDLALKKAKAGGVGVAVARNLGHVGMLAYYGEKIVRERSIGILCANGPAVVAPWGGGAKIFGTNPICLCFPIDDERSIMLDMATSATAHFKILMAAAKGEKILEGLALDKNRRPTTDAKAAWDGVMLPFGQFKGYGIMLATEVLSSALSSGLQGNDIILHGSTQGGFFVEAIDVSAFRPYEQYRSDMTRLAEKLKSCPPMEGFDEVLLPGEKEERERRRRSEDGIPIDPPTWQSLEKTAKELGVKMPELL